MFGEDDEEEEDANKKTSAAVLRASFIGDKEKLHLSAKKGDRANVLKVKSSWAWCEKDGKEGWLPISFLLKEDNGSATPTTGGGEAWPGDAGPEVPLKLPEMPARWDANLKTTLTFHTVLNLLRLLKYLGGLLPMGYAQVSQLHIAAAKGHVEDIDSVLAAAPTALRHWHSRTGELTPLHVGLLCGHQAVVEQLLTMDDLDPTIATAGGMQPLHIASASMPQAIDLLLRKGCDVNSRIQCNDTPLHVAAAHDRLDCVETLLRAQADPSAANKWGVTPLHIAAAHAGAAGHTAESATIALQLAAAGADPWAQDVRGFYPARMVVQAGGHSSLVALLQGLSVSDLDKSAKEGTPEAVALRVRCLAISLLQLEGPAVPEVAAGPPAPSAKASAAPSLADALCDLHEAREENQRFGVELQSKPTSAVPSGAASPTSLMGMAPTLQQRLEGAPAPEEESSKPSESARQKAVQLEIERDEVRKALQSAQEELRKYQLQAMQLEGKNVEAERSLATVRDEMTAMKAGQAKETERYSVAEASERQAAAQRAKEEAGSEVASAVAETARVKEHFSSELAALKSDIAANEATYASKEKKWDAEREEMSKALSAAELTLKDELDRSSKAELAAAASAKAHAEKFSEELSALQAEQKSTLEEAATLRAQAADMETWRKKAEDAEGKLKPYQERLEELRSAFATEQAMRKRYHNQMQDLKGAVRVFARIRPPVPREKGEPIAASRLDGFSLELKNKDPRTAAKTFQFDSVFDGQSTQEEVFEECRALVVSALDGYNVTIFAYGQTGAGKTHTMYGSDSAPGLVPRVADELFSTINRYGAEMQTSVQCGMLELYKDDLSDLLAKPKGKSPRTPPNQQPPALEVKKDASGSVYVENTVHRTVTSKEELLKAIQDGQSLRHVAATKMNADSSRSHLIVTVLVEVSNTKTKQVAKGKLTLCDLAGSERLKKSEASGDQMKEAQSINKSLTALGDVIEALTKKDKHIPYRNHKLTQLLSDSLGGNAKTLMFVNCSPVASNIDETNSSLSYAARAKLIMNKVEKSQESFEVSKLKKAMRDMEAELDQLRVKPAVETAEAQPS